MDWNVRKCLLLLPIILLLQTVTSELLEDYCSENCTDKVIEDNETSPRVLSRRKRFLTFPDGSSFQLVFCLQTSALIPIGDIFLYGNTVALAWSLPSDPDFFRMVKESEKAQRRGDTKTEIVYYNDKGKVVGNKPYKRKLIVNPVFAKRSVDEQNMTFKEKLKIKIDRLKMHEKQLNRDYLKQEHMTERSIEFHRSSRVELYEKIEKLITALGRNGRQCVLRKLCEASRPAPPRQGAFLQELLTIVFMLPKGSEFDYEEHKAYDEATKYAAAENCAEKYPQCENL